jgi:hypothetical protein
MCSGVTVRGSRRFARQVDVGGPVTVIDRLREGAVTLVREREPATVTTGGPARQDGPGL